MPKAVSEIDATQTFELKTCPEGFVKLRRLTYAEFLKRREVTSKLRVEMGNKNGQSSQGIEGDLSLLSAEVIYFEFANCIVDHNLEDANGNKLNFKFKQHVNMLDPRIGDEIGSYINEMNQFQPENLVDESVPVTPLSNESQNQD